MYLWGMGIGRRVVECRQCVRGDVDFGRGCIKVMVNEPMDLKRRIASVVTRNRYVLQYGITGWQMISW